MIRIVEVEKNNWIIFVYSECLMVLNQEKEESWEET